MSIKRSQRLMCSILGALCAAGAALACGTPPAPPPPPPDPPIVCCRIVSWFVDPICPNREVLILCYFREDGLPLFVSNPMPLPASQQCACAVGKLPPIPGVMDGGISFGPVSPAPLLESCIFMPSDQPGYGPFTPVCELQAQNAIDSFFDIFYRIGQIPTSPSDPCPRLATPVQFRGGPGQIIPSGVSFAVYRKVIIPAGLDPNLLCGTGLSAVGLFLIDAGQVLIEPAAPGLPPLNIEEFSKTGGVAAIYKVKCLPLDLLGPCPLVVPPFCPGDADGSRTVDFGDINTVISNWLLTCP